ncbi:MAG: hypothetical protein DRH07_11555, partial [Deltaproteobacteria bacterium]
MNLQEYLQQIEDLGELQIVKTSVDPKLELAALCRREFSKPQGGHALLFQQVVDSEYPVVANLFGSEQRASRLLHSDSFHHFSEKLQKLLQQKSGNVAERLQSSIKNGGEPLAAKETELLSMPDLDLLSLPAIKSWPAEGGSYLTL